jgi:hypothetical protein
MNDLLRCRGVAIDGLWLPPLQWRSGEFLCLHLPPPCDSHAARSVVRILTARMPCPAVDVMAHIVFAEPAAPPRGILGLLQSSRTSNWLRRQGIAPEAASAILERLELREDDSLACLAGTPRRLLGLEVARARGAEGVVFTTAGLDPEGVRKAYLGVASHLETCGALHVSFPFWTQGRLQRDCFLHARCMEVNTTTVIAKPA